MLLAEIEVRLQKLGQQGRAPDLTTLLLKQLGPNGSAVPAAEPAAAAQLLASLTANNARVQLGPLPAAGGPQPLDALLSRLKACTAFLYVNSMHDHWPNASPDDGNILILLSGQLFSERSDTIQLAHF